MTEQTQNVGQTRPRRWGSAGWAVAAKRDGRWLILPGRYETEAGAKLTAEFAALGGKVLVVEVSAGPDLAQRSEAEEPSEAVRCSELLAFAARWLEDAEHEERMMNLAAKAGRAESLSLHQGRMEMLQRCAREIGRAAEANAKVSDESPRQRL